MTADNTAYTLQVDTLALRDITFGNVVYAGTVRRNLIKGTPKQRGQI